MHLLRCKAEPLPQLDAFAAYLPSAEIISASFLARPTARVPRGAIWHIGNTSRTTEGGIFFALGRESVVTAQHFDEAAREFQEIEQIHAPFTVGVFDHETQVCGVLIRPGVSLNAREVAAKLTILLEESGIARKANSRISVDYIPDPEGFIEVLRTAHRITRFEFSFSLPNPPDDEKYIQRPLKRFAQRAGGSEGKASIRGGALNSQELIDVAKAVAATGDNATANVQMNEGGDVQRRSLSVTAVREPIDGQLHEGTGDAMMRSIRRGYLRIRGPNDGE